MITLSAGAGYRGRFAPSPTGPLHPGSLVSALASFLDARFHGGQWLVRIDDLDTQRTVPGMAEHILATLNAFGMRSDEPPVRQSSRSRAYGQAFEILEHAGLVYPCGCTRKEIADSLLGAHERHVTLAYPGTCRGGLHGKPARAWRVRVPDGDQAQVVFADRWQGMQRQDLATQVGDFVVKRADGEWAYQLAVVVDDAEAGITHVVRGADLMDSTARQIYLQACLGTRQPEYLHVPVVTNADGEKLSKQSGASSLDAARLLPALRAAAAHLGLSPGSVAGTSLAEFFEAAVPEWGRRQARLREDGALGGWGKGTG
jgi:glutamyl-Q tRNA(Asp) synthetase